MIGKLLLVVVLVLTVIAVVVTLGEKFPGFKLGRLPGDIVIEKDGNTLFIPITSVLVVSLLLTLGFSLLRVKP